MADQVDEMAMAVEKIVEQEADEVYDGWAKQSNRDAYVRNAVRAAAYGTAAKVGRLLESVLADRYRAQGRAETADDIARTVGTGPVEEALAIAKHLRDRGVDPEIAGKVKQPASDVTENVERFNAGAREVPGLDVWERAPDDWGWRCGTCGQLSGGYPDSDDANRGRTAHRTFGYCQPAEKMRS